MGFVARHWRGDYSLARSFWVNGWLLFIPVLALQVVVLIAARRLGYGGGVDFVRVLIAVGTLAYLFVLWQLVGLWRSAGNARRAGRRFWPAATQVFIVVVVALNVGGLALKSIPAMQRMATQQTPH